MTAVASAVLNEVLPPPFLPQVQVNGVYLRQTLQTLSAQFGLGEVRGQGLLLALDTGVLDAHAIVQHSLVLGLLINAPRPHTLRFMPALNVSRAEIQAMSALLVQALAAVLQSVGN